MNNKYNKDSSIELLKRKYMDLLGKGIYRYPQRSDFEKEEIVAIKEFLGPWPRALEAAGLKPPKNGDVSMSHRVEKIRVKHRHTKVLKKQTK